MPDRDGAIALIAAATRDMAALDNMLDTRSFATEVFGFHAQQVVEKSLKAWLSLKDVAYPTTHSLRTLLALLEISGADVSDLWDFVALSAFAVQFRYDAYDFSAEPLDRSSIRQRVQVLLDRVKRMLDVPPRRAESHPGAD
jgi:HEPN domain-containing protein